MEEVVVHIDKTEAMEVMPQHPPGSSWGEGYWASITLGESWDSGGSNHLASA